jgi:hypothetical protein
MAGSEEKFAYEALQAAVPSSYQGVTKKFLPFSA